MLQGQDGVTCSPSDQEKGFRRVTWENAWVKYILNSNTRGEVYGFGLF